MPYDSVYSEKRPPGTLRTAWRKFYSDASAMVGLYGCAGLAVLCIFGGWFAPYGIDLQVMRRALSSQQLAARIEAYDEAQSILAQELPILPLASSLRLQAYRYDIKGLVLSPFGNASFAGVYREKQDEVKKP